MTKPASTKSNSNKNNAQQKKPNRSKSPKQRQRRSASPKQRRRKSPTRRRSRPDAVVFPPDPNETGLQVVNRVLAAYGVSDQFPADCQQQVADVLAAERENPWKKTETNDDTYADLTHLPYITIDGPHTQDLDQALFLARQNLPGRNAACRTDHTPSTAQAPNGYLVSYAIADGNHFVPAQSPLFQFALQRGGTSFYLPGKAVPMLPRALSQGVMSLLPNVKRRALIFDLYLNAEGHPLKTFYQWGYIQSRWKGTYQEVNDYYMALEKEKAHNHPLNQHEYADTLKLLQEVGLKRRRLAEERHAFCIQKEQRVGVTLNQETGRLVLANRAATGPTPAELYNEQMSLLCNSEGAKLLHFMDALEDKSKQDEDIIHPIYRSQKEPTPQQIALLEQVISTTLMAHHLDVQTHGWSKDDESISQYLTRLRTRRDSYKEQSPDYRVWSVVCQIVERQALATNQAATLSTTSSAHFGLQMDYYARFSSPMRELVGCFTHKELWEAKARRSSLTTEADLQLRQQIIRAARRAKLLQKKLSGAIFLHLMNLLFYKDLKKPMHKRPIRKGVLLGVNFALGKTRRCYVQLQDDPAIEIKVFAQDLEYFYNCRYVVCNDNTQQQPNSKKDSGSAALDCAAVAAIGPLVGSFKEDVDDQNRPPIFRVGQRVTIRVADYAQFYGQTSRSRWCFMMDLDPEERIDDACNNNPPAHSSQNNPQRSSALLRNSILDIDLYSTRDSTASTVASSDAQCNDDFAELKDLLEDL